MADGTHSLRITVYGNVTDAIMTCVQQENAMKVYQMSWSGANEGVCLYWTSSKADALRVAHEVIEEGPDYGMCDFTIKQIEIPTSKRQLLAWLNANFDRDNG